MINIEIGVVWGIWGQSKSTKNLDGINTTFYSTLLQTMRVNLLPFVESLGYHAAFLWL